MTKSVLSVGQCAPDSRTLSNYLRSHFEVEIDTASVMAEALSMMKVKHYDLVLINRKLDADYTDGTEILKAIKADPQLSPTPVMIITNYEEQQNAAIALGAERGFGKLEYDLPQTREKLARYLDKTAAA